MKKYMKESVPTNQVETARKILTELPALYKDIDEAVEWLDIELEDYVNGEIEVSDAYIRKVIEIALDTKASLINIKKQITRGINNLPD